MDTAPLILIAAPPLQESDPTKKLPLPTKNIFTRIIRNPHIESELPRERHCAEMLASLLINAARIRFFVCGWLAQISNASIDFSRVTRIEISTEQWIGFKRDDLRIQGWTKTEDSEERTFLWTIEVKVGAGFHLTSVRTPHITTESHDDLLVNQLEPYDAWLRDCVATNKAGFVLALEDMTNELPEICHERWKCVTWTELGLQLREALGQSDLPHIERFICKHVVGFIVDNFWRSEQMADGQIDFDDVALLRAMELKRNDCESKMRAIIEPLSDLPQWKSFGAQQLKLNNALFGKRGKLAYEKLLTKDPNGPTVSAGLAGGLLHVWISSPTRYSLKSIVRARFPKLEKQKLKWSLGDEGSTWDLSCELPLTNLLNSANQSAAVRSFVSQALDDLIAVGLLKAISK